MSGGITTQSLFPQRGVDKNIFGQSPKKTGMRDNNIGKKKKKNNNNNKNKNDKKNKKE